MPKSIVITVHGIRTFGQWQMRLRELVHEADSEIRVTSYRYGYFSVLAFIVPIFRWIEVRRFRKHLKRLILANPTTPISIVAHSFGTYIVARGLQGINAEELPQIPVILLSGSVLRSSFDWSRLTSSGKIGWVVNDCGASDNVLLLSQVGVLFTGMAGRVGFYGFTDEVVVNRFFAGGHSHYFEPSGSDPNSFMRRWWVPLLIQAAPPPLVDEQIARGPMQGAWYAFMRFADPLKLAGYLGVGGLIVFFAAVQPRWQVRVEQALREYAAASAQFSSDRMVPNAVEALMGLIEGGTLSRTPEGESVATLARYGVQRLAPHDAALAAIPVGQLFRWEGSTFLHGDGPIRPEIVDPLVQFPLVLQGVTIAASENLAQEGTRLLTVVVLNARNGRIVLREELGYGGRLSEMELFYLRGSPQKLLVFIRTREIEGDNTQLNILAIDLENNSINLQNHKVRMRVAPDCSRGAWVEKDDEDDRMEVTSFNMQAIFRPLASDGVSAQIVSPSEVAIHWPILGSIEDTCTEAVTASPLPTLRFPRLAAEQDFYVSDVLSVEELITFSCSLPEEDARSDRYFRRPERLDWRNATFSPSLDREQFINEFSEISDCPRLLRGRGGAAYIAKTVVRGLWIGGWAICELRDQTKIGRCSVHEFPSEGGGRLLHQDGDDLAGLITGRTETNSNGFVLLRLADGTTIRPDLSPETAVTSVAIQERNRYVAATAVVRGTSNEVEVLVYRLEGSVARFIGRRRFSGSPSTSQAAASIVSPAPQLAATNSLFVLSMAPDSILALKIDDSAAERWFRFWSRSAVPQQLITIHWTILSTGLGENTSAQIWNLPDLRVAVITAGSQMRLLLLEDGTLLTPGVDFTQFSPVCRGHVLAVGVGEAGSFVVDLPRCRITRTAPPDISHLRSIFTSRSNLVYH